MKHPIPILVILVLNVALAACTASAGSLGAAPPVGPTQPPVSVGSPGVSSDPSPMPTARAQEPDETLTFNVYFLMHDPRGLEFLVPVQRSVARTDGVLAAAMRELLAGPTADERSGVYPGRIGTIAPLSTALPSGTQLIDIEVGRGVATVNLSDAFGSGDHVASFVNRQAQIVHTLTQFTAVHGVAFRIDGEPAVVIDGHEASASFGPATRRLYFDQRRSVFVHEPAWGARVADTVIVRGETTRDAELRIALIDGATGRILVEQTVDASCLPCIAPDAWGAFEARLPVPAEPYPSDLRLRIWEPPYGEGDPSTVVDYPLAAAAPASTAGG